ncbi:MULTISPECIES: zinc-binding dehydrogenase [unclassified Mesorhizobium]|uniref:zinc-binding dehydrogenase n=1 Tax=unclassified Mesorhizobium TaxID=325217 RepID=UPI0018DE92F5|nr:MULTISPECIES: zinc-binding dehydrogenase [unclassified Mesorhizobium]WJI59235.1 zinc-binding dehydrogenase [Mesorhizobium sp. C432A]
MPTGRTRCTAGRWRVRSSGNTRRKRSELMKAIIARDFAPLGQLVHADNLKELVGWHLAGKVRPVIEGTYPLADAATVVTRVLGRGASGKLILKL